MKIYIKDEHEIHKEGLFNLIKKDLNRVDGISFRNFLKWYFWPLGGTFPYIVWMRIYHRLNQIGAPKLIKLLPYIVFRHYEYKYGIHGGTDISVGDGLLIVHGDGVYLNCKQIGRNVTIYQGVTLGKGKDGMIPTIGDDVIIYPNAVICGGITIGNGVIIGANSFVKHNVPPYDTVAGVPARSITGKKN